MIPLFDFQIQEFEAINGTHSMPYVKAQDAIEKMKKEKESASSAVPSPATGDKKSEKTDAKTEEKGSKEDKEKKEGKKEDKEEKTKKDDTEVKQEKEDKEEKKEEEGKKEDEKTEKESEKSTKDEKEVGKGPGYIELLLLTRSYILRREVYSGCSPFSDGVHSSGSSNER